MGRNCCPAQSHCLRSSVAEPAIIIIIINMQNHHHQQHHHQHPSHAQTHPPPSSSPPSPILPPLVCLRKDVSQGERFERGSGRDRKLRIPVSGVDSDYDKDAGKPDSDLPDVFEDCLSCPPPKRSIDTDSVSGTAHHHHHQQQQQQLLQQQRCEDGNSVENVPSVPDIVIQYAATPPVANQRPVPATSRTALRHSDSSDPVGGLFAKKGRTHSDSAIYESELKKQCLLGSFGGGGGGGGGGGPRSLSCAPSGGHLACNVSGVGPLVVCDTEAEIAAAAASEFTGDGDDDGGGGGRVTSAYFGQKEEKKESQFLKPISWNSCRLDQFTLAEERSPKLYWLRRHSDSTVSNDDNMDVPEAEAEAEAEERCTWRPQSIGGEIEPETVKCGSEDPDKVLHWCAGVPAEGGCSPPDERRKCLKVKKYLQTRYQNQMIVDTDDVFVDVATDYRPEQQQQQQVLQNWPVAEEASRSLSRRELTDSPSGGGGGGAGGGDDDGGIAEVMTPGSISKSPDRQHGCLLSSDTAAEGDSSRNAACRRFPRRTGDDDVRRFQNDVTAAPVTSLLLPPTPTTRQTIFDFSFAAAAYSVLGDMSADCSGANGVVFGLLPQNCFPTTTTTMTPAFVSSPLSADNIRNSFSLLNSSSSSSSSSVPVSAVSADLVSDSKRWQFGLVVGGGDGGGGGGDCARRRRSRIKKRTDHSSDGPPDCSSPSPSPHSPSSGQRQSASNNSTDGATCSVTKDAEALPSSSSSSSSSVTVVVSSQLLACPSPTSSSSSPSAAVTPTSKSCPRVVFDYQFSERINEQRQARGDGAGGGGGGGSFVCPVCASVQPSYNSLANHVVSHLPSEVIAPPDGSGAGGGGDSSKVHLCRVCNRSFSRSDMLSRHMRLHTGLRPYECHLCQQVFSRSDHLHTHLRTHTGEKPYRCSHCLYAASRRDMVTRHMRIHVRGGGKRGRRSSSTSSLASEAGQTSGDDNGVFDNNTPAGGRHNHQPARRRPVAGPGGGGSGGRASCSLPKQRNWSVASSADYNDAAPGQECSSFEDRDLLLRMTRTESTTSIDSGVSYLTPRSLVPSLWSPGIDSPDVFSRYPGHFLWPSSSSSTGADVKHDPDRSVAVVNASSSRDTDFEMQASFQKFQVVSPLEQRFSVDSNELLGDQQREEECV